MADDFITGNTIACLGFFILYINFNKKTIDNSVSDNKNTEITTPIFLDKDYPPLQTQTDSSTSNATKNTVTDERSLDKASLPQTTAKPETPKNVTTDYKKTEKINNSNDKMLKSTAGTVIADNQIIEFNPNVPENTEAVSVAINNAGLLGMDTPAQNTFGKTNKEYDAAKSDLDQTNNQLSDAINEVKKRNQQKIDELHQQSPYPEESNDIFK
ncbi:hypothetical protein [Psychrobacter sp. DAB_AL43B]|uniref:hypothetical protein n=1 Tax=Psychrobacter sp. DAB_AL43B TaxID=1028416 RepID=UPI0009A77D6B|nr:hypothetical protein [Psychrobacter sp. DAB_AL43B]SLJ84790.1 hypothetical protein DABAL43B_1595 [Psychrobacter sp. DAB_AL43B]